MNRNLKQQKFELLILVIIFFVILIISGSTRINPMLELLTDLEIIEGARITAYLSLIFGSVFYIVLLLLTFIFLVFLAQYPKDGDSFSVFLEASSAFILSLCFFEVLRVALTFAVFEKSIHSITDIDLLTEQIKNTAWWKYDRMLSIVNTIVSSLVFFFFCRRKKRDMKYLLPMAIMIFIVNLLLKLL